MAAFHLLNFGCRASQADGAALKRRLLEAGLVEAADVEKSQIAILNTCTVTASADREARQVVRRIHRINPSCRILVTGCYAQRAPQEIAQLSGVTWVVGNSHKHRVAEFLAQPGAVREESIAGEQVPGGVSTPPDLRPTLVQIQENMTALQPAPGGNNVATEKAGLRPRAQVFVGEISEEFHFAPVFPDDRTRPTVKIQDGCSARCSFCIIPSVRGASRSLAPGKVIEEVRRLERAGYQEIVLSGINIGSYGRDLDRRCTFLGLLERMLTETNIARLRISSIEPMDVSPELIRLVAREERLADHFHVPLQSGCDRILRQMNRRYWTRQYSERILAIHKEVPNCGIGADVMVGFPGETKDDHAASLRFIASLPFTYLHVFPYSPRPGTPAAARPDQVDGRVAHERGQEVRNLAETKRRAYLENQIGRTLSALTLDEADGDARLALTSNYLKAALPASTAEPNTLVKMRVGRADGARLYGYAEN